MLAPLGRPVRAADKPMSLVEIDRYESPWEAHIAAGRLEAEGMNAVVFVGLCFLQLCVPVLAMKVKSRFKDLGVSMNSSVVFSMYFRAGSQRELRERSRRCHRSGH